MSRARDLADLAGSADAGGITGKNLIINGAMQVAQRGTVTGATHDSYGGPDRYKISESGDTVFTMSKDSDTPTGKGFANSLKLDVTTADSSLAASDYASVIYNIEGQDLQRIKKGTSSAESVTLSFYIKSTITGTYVVQLYDNDNNRSVSKSYTVSSADTWEKKTLTFPADTTGAFDNDNALSLLIRWWFAAGTDYTSGTLATSWESYNGANAAVGQVNAVNSASNNIFITGVQLELGDTATPFEHRSYGDELARCQRYYQKDLYIGNNVIAIGTTVGTSEAYAPMSFSGGQMRTSPTITLPTAGQGSNLMTFLKDNSGYPTTTGSHSVTAVSNISFRLAGSSYVGLSGNGVATWLYPGPASGSVYFEYDAEL